MGMGSPKIKFKAQVLITHNDKVLVYRVKDKETGLHIYRLVGGHVEFGELSEKAAIREFYEETMIEVHRPKLVGSFENIHIMHGKNKHEYLHVYACEFKDAVYYTRERIKLFEEGEILNDAEWVERKFLCLDTTPFYPQQLKNILLEKNSL
jgi:ADP-ribose pyrophosphatase YjhB (NUDIX family)